MTPARGRELREVALAAAVMLLAALAVVAPVLAAPRRLLIGDVDGLQSWLADYWWRKSLLAWLWSARSLHGVVSVLRQVQNQPSEAGNLTDMFVMSMPLERLFGFPLYYNVKCLLVLAANGMAAWLLVRRWTGSRGAALLAGVVFTANFYVVRLLGFSRIREVIIFPMPLCALFFARWLETRRRRDAFWAGAFLGMTAAFYWFYGLFLLIGCLVALGAARTWRDPRMRRGILAGMAGTLLVAGPWALPYLDRTVRQGQPDVSPGLVWMRSFPSRAAIAEHRVNPTRDPYADDIVRFSECDYLVGTGAAVMPIAVTLFALCGVWLGGRRERLWAVGFVACFVLALGPYYEMAARPAAHSWPLPYLVAYKVIPFLSRMRQPDRLTAPALLALVLLCGVGFAKIADRMRTRARALACGVAIATYFVTLRAAGTLPAQAVRLDVPPFYRGLHAGVIEMPIWRVIPLNVYYYQTVHRQPVITGTWMVWPDPRLITPVKVRAYLPAGNTFLGNLQRMSTPGGAGWSFAARDLDALVRLGFRYVVLHERPCRDIGPGVWKRLRARLAERFGPPREGEELTGAGPSRFAVYRLRL